MPVTDIDGQIWPSSVHNVYKWKNGANKGQDSLSNNDLTVYGSPTLSTTNTKFGNAWTNNATLNGFQTPAGLNTYLAGQTSWTLEFWQQLPPVASYGTFEECLFTKWSSAGGTGAGFMASVWFPSTDFLPYYYSARWNTAGDVQLGAGDYTTTWRRLSFCYNGNTNVGKVYINGILFQTYNTPGNVFSTGQVLSLGYDPQQGAICTLRGQLDRFTVSNIDTAGVEVKPLDAPIPTTCTPSSGTTLGGTSVNIAGILFQSGCTVTFGGVAATGVTFNSSISITCTTPAHAPGAVNVVVTNPDTQTGTIINGYTYAAPSITSTSPISDTIFGGNTITINGANFAPGITLTVDGTSTAVTYVSSSVLTFTSPAHSAATVALVVTNTDGYSASVSFTYLDVTIYNPKFPYALKINNKDVTNFQLNRFTQQEEMNVLDRYDLSLTNIAITCPFSVGNIFLTGFNDVITITKNNLNYYKGWISGKRDNYLNRQYYLDVTSFLSLLSKRTAIYNLSVADPITQIIAMLTPELPTTLKEQYTISPKSGFLSLQYTNMPFSVNSNGNEVNIINTIIDICKLFDIGIFIKGTSINLIPFGSFPKNAIDINDTTRFPEGLPYIANAELTERRDVFYDNVSLNYYNSVGGAQKTVTTGTGLYTEAVSTNNIFMTDAVAALIASHKQGIKNVLYRESQFRMTNQISLGIGDYFKYNGYVFLIKAREEKLAEVIFKVIGKKI